MVSRASKRMTALLREYGKAVLEQLSPNTAFCAIGQPHSQLWSMPPALQWPDLGRGTSSAGFWSKKP